MQVDQPLTTSVIMKADVWNKRRCGFAEQCFKCCVYNTWLAELYVVLVGHEYCYWFC